MPQFWVNNWSTTLAAEALTADTVISVPSADAAKLGSLSAQDFVHLTLEGAGAVEIVRATAVSGGNLTVARAQEGATAQDWPAGTRIEVRVTAEGLAGLREVDRILTAAGAVLVGAEGNVLIQ